MKKKEKGEKKKKKRKWRGLKLWEKNDSSERGRGKMIEMHNIYPCNAFHMIEHSAF